MNYREVDVISFAAAAWPDINWAMTGCDIYGYVAFRGVAHGHVETRRLDTHAFRSNEEIANGAFKILGDIAFALQIFSPKVKRLSYHRPRRAR